MTTPWADEVYYWDTCVFLAWLMNETDRKPGEMEGVQEVLDKLMRQQVAIVTSTITITEAYQARLPAGADELFLDFLKRRNVHKVSVDVRVATLARNIRNYYAERPNEYNNKNLTVPDALHLATSILYKVKAFHTFDESNKRSLGLLGLSGNVGGYPLIVSKPESKQLGLQLS